MSEAIGHVLGANLPSGIEWQNVEVLHPVLTKREYFAAMALVGILSYPAPSGRALADCADYAVRCADHLIEQLNNDRPVSNKETQL